MSELKLVLVAHMGHDAPWLQIKTRKQIRERRMDIKMHKPKHERPLRLKLLKIVKEPLPPKLQKAYAEWQKADAEWQKADAAWVKAINTREGVAFHKRVCGCAWTPKKPDILLQLAAQREEKEDE